MAYYKNFTMGTVTLTDGTSPTALTHTCDMDKGTLQISGVVPGLRESADYERKGAWVSSAYTGRKYPTGTLTFNFAVWKDTSNGTISDFIMGTTGTPYASRVSTIAPSGATAGKVPLAFDLGITVEGTDYGDSADHSGTLTDCRIDDWSFSEGDPNEISISFTVLGAITGDFAASVA